MARSPQPPSVSLDLWRPALAAALEFRTLAPWVWMDDTAISVHVDENGAPWFACVMGNAREIFGLVLYRGEEGFRALHALHQAETEAAMEDARFLQSAIDVTFGPKSMLDSHDLARLKALGYAPPRGSRLAWPSFRSHRPGCVQWHLDEAEVRVLASALPRVARFAESLRQQANCYEERGIYEYPLLGDESKSPDQLEWRHWVPPPEPPVVAVRLPDDAAAEALRRLPVARKLTLEVDLFHALAPIADGDRPYYPRQVSIVRGDNGMVVGMEILPPEKNGPPAVGNVLLDVIQRLGMRPQTLLFAREPLARALLPLAEQLGIAKVNLTNHLPMTAEFRASFDEFFGR